MRSPQGRSSSSSSSSRTRGLLGTWRVSIPCGEAGKEELSEAHVLAQNPGPRHPPTSWARLQGPLPRSGLGQPGCSPLISPPQPPQRAVTQTRGLGAPGQPPLPSGSLGAASGNEEPGVGALPLPWQPPTNWYQELGPEGKQEGERQTDREVDTGGVSEG